MISYILVVLPILIRVAFVTLLERKILGLSQHRKGPNKVRLGGLLQPIADAVKLFLKENIYIRARNKILFTLAPGMAIVLILFLSSNLPMEIKSGFPALAVLILRILGLGVYPVFVAGWRSNSKYSLLGRIRGVAQTISYEISLALFLFVMFIFYVRYNIRVRFEDRRFNIIIGFPLILFILIRAVAETNRTPFDFAEGESELVSGFNTEYGAGLFALIFMAEYGIIIFFSYFFSFLIRGAGILRTLRLVLGQTIIFV